MKRPPVYVANLHNAPIFITLNRVRGLPSFPKLFKNTNPLESIPDRTDAYRHSYDQSAAGSISSEMGCTHFPLL